MLSLNSVIEQFLYHSKTPGVHYLITPNQRLSAVLCHSYDRLQQQQNKSAWLSLTALSWDNYLHALWAQLHTLHAVWPSAKPLPQLLSAQQEFVLWEKIIEQSEHTKPLLRPKAAVQLAIDTYALMRNWTLTAENITENMNLDWPIFENWLDELTETLTQTQSIVQVDLISEFMQQNLASLFAQKTYVWLYGFERLTPAQTLLLDHLTKQYGVSYQQLTKTPQRAKIQQQGFADKEAEYHACALWIQQQLEQNPEIRLGVVVQQLTQDRGLITKILREYLCPETLVNRQWDDLTQWVNVSGGISLARAPMVHDALIVLSVALKNYRKNKTNQQNSINYCVRLLSVIPNLC